MKDSERERGKFWFRFSFERLRRVDCLFVHLSLSLFFVMMRGQEVRNRKSEKDFVPIFGLEKYIVSFHNLFSWQYFLFLLLPLPLVQKWQRKRGGERVSIHLSLPFSSLFLWILNWIVQREGGWVEVSRQLRMSWGKNDEEGSFSFQFW